VTQGILRGMGKQPLVAAYNLLDFWGVGLTTQYNATFPGGMRLLGIWIGIVAGLAAVGMLPS
jgi:Na+-driven multidrug efflux pump